MVRPSVGVVHGERSPEPPAQAAATAALPQQTWALLSALQPMVGRDRLLEATRARMQHPATRLSTLVGPVGVGKSRLARALADFVSARCPRSAHVVDLRAAGGAAPGPAVATALGLPTAGVADLAEQLGGASMLLVLDGCEVARDQVVELVSILLPAAPGVQVLATGREPLGLHGEHVVTVPPLEVPDPARTWTPQTLAEVPAVALFLQRVAAVRPEFRLTAGNCDVVAELCRRVDGLPLALEQAAARLKVLQPQALLLRLERGPDVLAAAAGPAGTRPGMGGALADHVGALPAEARSLLVELSVFPAGFDLAGVEAVTGTAGGGTQRVLELLVDRSLVQRYEQSDRELRFALLNTTRTFVRARHTDGVRDGDLRARHARHYQAVAVGAAAGVDGAQGERHLATLAAEHPNIAEAYRYLMDSRQVEQALGLAAALVPHWMALGRPGQGLSWLERALGTGADGGDATVPALRAAGRLAAGTGDHRKAATLQRQAIELARARGDGVTVQEAVHELAVTAYLTGDLEQARSLLQEGSRRVLRGGGRPGDEERLVDIAALRLAEGSAQAALQVARVALAMSARTGNRYTAARARAVLARIALLAGEPDPEPYCREALATVRSFDPVGVTAPLLETLAAAEAEHEEPARRRHAVRLLAAAARRRELHGLPLPAVHAEAVDGLDRRLRAALGPRAHTEEWQAGRLLTPEAALVAGTGSCPVDEPPPSAALLSLTPRQQEVAELIGHGLTNREIARRLGVAEWTAVNHVRQVLRKLNCSSRVQVTRLMVQRERPPSAHPQPPAVSRS